LNSIHHKQTKNKCIIYVSRHGARSNDAENSALPFYYLYFLEMFLVQ